MTEPLSWTETRWRCPRCRRTTYHPQDVAHHYCACCGSEDGLLPKDCPCPPLKLTDEDWRQLEREWRQALERLRRLVATQERQGTLSQRRFQRILRASLEVDQAFQAYHRAHATLAGEGVEGPTRADGSTSTPPLEEEVPHALEARQEPPDHQ